MKHWGNIIVDSEHNIVGRGLVFAVSLVINKLTRHEWVDDVFFDIDDTFDYDTCKYQIKGIEMKRNLLDYSKISSNIGLNVVKLDN
jgi:hypothetical protein